MQIVTGQQMAEIDRRTIEEYGLDGEILMETAGLAVARRLRRLGRGKVAFLCGPGNNGGDGYVAARHWTDWGFEAHLFALGENRGANARRAERWGIPQTSLEGEPPGWDGYVAVVDALFGTGLTRSLQGDVAAWVESLPAERTLAVDIPSGVHADTGQILGTAVRACQTVTFGLPKLGQLLQPGAAHCGRLWVEPIGFPRKLLQGDGLWLQASQARPWLPRRGPLSHKRSTGKVLIVAGSPQYPGAGILAALGALRGGAGLVYVCAPECVHQRLPVEAIPVPFHDLELVGKGMDAVCVGPGLADQGELVERVLRLHLPTVVDADAFRFLPSRLSPQVLLTPHHGEMARLLRLSVPEVEQDRLGAAVRAARNWNCTVLLKGDPTLVTTAGGRYLLVNEGTPVLAQGGSGDVLSGLTTALLGQGLDAWEAGGLAAYLHGRAGRLGGVTVGLGASALADRLPQAWTELQA